MIKEAFPIHLFIVFLNLAGFEVYFRSFTWSRNDAKLLVPVQIIGLHILLHNFKKSITSEIKLNKLEIELTCYAVVIVVVVVGRCGAVRVKIGMHDRTIC